MFQPGRDDNYPTSSGNVPAGLLGSQVSLSGFHISVCALGVIVLLLLVWNLAKRRRR